MPGTTSTALPSFSHDQQRETDAAKRKGGIFQLKMMVVVVITGANKTSKAPVKSLQLTNQHPAFYRPCCQSTNSVIASRGKTVANISIFCNRTKTLICTACTRAHTHSGSNILAHLTCLLSHVMPTVPNVSQQKLSIVVKPNFLQTK